MKLRIVVEYDVTVPGRGDAAVRQLERWTFDQLLERAVEARVRFESPDRSFSYELAGGREP